jgi:ethanolamine kinase
MIAPTHLEFKVDVSTPGQLEKDALSIVRLVRKDWSDKKISVKRFTDGITNILIGCFLQEDPDNVILVRVYGEMSNLYLVIHMVDKFELI